MWYVSFFHHLSCQGARFIRSPPPFGDNFSNQFEVVVIESDNEYRYKVEIMNNEEQRILDIKVKYEDAITGIVEYQKKIDELAVSELKLKAQMKNAPKGENLEPYRKQLVAVKEATKEYRDNIRVLSKEIQNNLKQEQGHKDSLRAMRAELSNCVKAYDSLSRIEREGAKGRALADHINVISKELKEAEESTSRFYRSVGSYENAIKNCLGLNNKFADSLLNISKGGGGLSGVIKGAETSVRAFGKTLAGLMGNPVFLALAGIVGAGAAFKWFFDYNKGIEKATRLTKEFLGLTGSELKAMRSEIQATADTFGKDYVEVLQTVDNLVAQYGISAQEALKNVNDGFIAGADLSGNMLSQISRYSASFHDAGIEADELVAILSQTRSGIFSDKGMALIEMASKKIREMSSETASSLDAIGISSRQVEADLGSGAKSTFDIIQDISNKLRELPQDSKEVGEILKDVFGRQGASGGLKMIEELGTMTKKLEDVKSVTGEYGKEQERQLKASAELNSVMAALFDISEKGFGEMLVGAKSLAIEGLGSVGKGLIKVINYLVDLYNNSLLVRGGVEVVSLSLKGLWNVAKLVFGFFIDQIKGIARAFKGLAGIIEGALTFDPGKMVEGFKGVMDAVGKTAKEMYSDFKKFGRESADAYVEAFNSTMKGRSLKRIEVPQSTQGAANLVGGKLTGPTGGKGVSGVSVSKSGTSEAVKKEMDEVRKAEDLLTKIVEDSYEQRRKIVREKYDRQITDIQERLQKEKGLTTKARVAMNDQIKNLEVMKNRELERLSEEEMKRAVEFEQKRISLILGTVKKGSLEERDLKLKQLNNQEQLDIEQAKKDYHNEEEREQMILAILKSYEQKREDLENDFFNQYIKDAEEQIRKEYAIRLSAEDNEIEKLRIKVEEKKAILDAARQMEGESQEEWVIRRAQMNDEVARAESDLTKKEEEEARKRQEYKIAEFEASEKLMGGLSDLFKAFGEDNKELTQLSKMLALANIAISTGEAISKGVATAADAGPFPANLAAIATTVAQVLANMATAIKTVKSAKYAEGGDVVGPGTGTSDSVAAMLSNGESVMTAKATKMFAPVLSVLNQMGGGLPIAGSPQQITVSGGDTEKGLELISEAIKKGMEAAPAPKVSVEEIERVQNRCKSIKKMGVIE